MTWCGRGSSQRRAWGSAQKCSRRLVALGLRGACRHAGNARVDTERVGAGREDLVAVAVTPGVPGGAIVSQERHETLDGLHALGGMSSCDARMRVAPRLAGFWSCFERLLQDRFGAKELASLLGERASRIAHATLDGSGQVPPQLRRVELGVNRRTLLPKVHNRPLVSPAPLRGAGAGFNSDIGRNYLHILLLHENNANEVAAAANSVVVCPIAVVFPIEDREVAR